MSPRYISLKIILEGDLVWDFFFFSNMINEKLNVA